ncbi:MAG TPA: hypothetical protein VF042_10120, partial [Gemmatimonadaceae bacterium]
IQGSSVKVYLKGSSLPASTIRGVLRAAYSAHENPLVRQALANVDAAEILPADFSLSELIAVERRVANSPIRLPGWTGVATSIRANRVLVTFQDSTFLQSGARLLASIGVPAAATVLEIREPASLQAKWTDHIRPTGGGIEIVIGNESKKPGRTCVVGGVTSYCYYYTSGSLGYNVQTSDGTNYFLTASHIANVLYAGNGAVGDTVWQPFVGARGLYAPIGTISVNPAWDTGTACKINPLTGTNYDFCTTADAMLGAYIAGTSFSRKIGTSVTGGINGNVGSSSINNFYSVTAVLSPEYVNDTLHHDGNKSGKSTGTTSGQITSPMWEVPVAICWPQSDFCVKDHWLGLLNVGEVHATSTLGDSGGPVFTGFPNQGAPYAAMGILVAGSGAGNPCTGNACYFYFARWDMLEQRLGVGTLNPRTTIP